MYPLYGSFEDLLLDSGTMHLVIGANEAAIRRADIEDVLDLIDVGSPSATATLTLVAADDALMHSKTYYIEREDGTKHALVGSVNLTHPGMARNIEAALAIDSTSDPNAPFDEIKAAIERWHKPPLPSNAYSVTRESVQTLIEDGLLDVERVRPPVSPASRKKRGKLFPALGAILQLPRKKRAVAPRKRQTPAKRAAQSPVGTLGTLPNGRVGILKRLSSLDVKGFHGGTGTLYIALPAELAPFLPMTPYGKNAVPRVDVIVEARMEEAPDDVVLSGSSPTNITHEGVGTTQISHSDLRFNYHRGVQRGIARVAAENALEVPDVGDLAAIELLEGVRIRITFVTDATSIANLTPLLDQRGGSWGWLPPGTMGPWDEVDA